MQELKFKNLISSLIVFTFAVILSTASSYINIAPFDLPVPLLIIGAFVGFLILNFVAYPKAKTEQIVQLTITGFFINAAIFTAAVFAIKYFKFAVVSVDSDFILSINPIVALLSFLFSFIVLISIVKFENKSEKPLKTVNPKENHSGQKDEETEPETIAFEEKNVNADVNTNNENSFKPEEKPKSVYEELYPQAEREVKSLKTPEENEFFFGSIQDDAQGNNETKKEDKKSFNTDEDFIQLESLPSINFEDNNSETPPPPAVPKPEGQENYNFIPTDIRLIEAPVSKDKESKGKISSIGKLLVNNRDIEGVIESNAEVFEQRQEGKTSIISSVSGEQIHEKFNKLQQEFTQLREIALIDKGGFIMASNYQDKMKIHITGAIIAGAYHTLENYLAQISFKQPKKIFFETENSNNFIIKTNEELLFSTWDKDFKPVDYGTLEDFIENEDISGADFTPLIELNQIKDFAVSDRTGKLIRSVNNNEDSEKLAIISSALFENFKVFLMNMQLLNLKRISIFNEEDVITIKKFGDDTASFVTPVTGSVKISGDFLKTEEIYQQ